MRLFLALLPDNKCRAALEKAARELQNKAKQGNITLDENIHLTLIFIGETDRLEQVKSCLEKCRGKPFPLAFEDIGRFKRGGGDIVWVGVKPDPALLALHSQLSENLVRAGFDLDNRPYRPHLTLGRRIVFHHSQGLKELQASFPGCEMTANRISLMCSERINGRLTYTEIAWKEL